VINILISGCPVERSLEHRLEEGWPHPTVDLKQGVEIAYVACVLQPHRGACLHVSGSSMRIIRVHQGSEGRPR